LTIDKLARIFGLREPLVAALRSGLTDLRRFCVNPLG